MLNNDEEKTLYLIIKLHSTINILFDEILELTFLFVHRFNFLLSLII